MTDQPDTEPQWTEAGFHRFLHGLAHEHAPRLFAIANEYGTRHDAEIAAYGLVFPDHVEVVTIEGDFRTLTDTAENALGTFTRMATIEGTKAHLLWLDEAMNSL
ncbi:hypothetical protein [Actinosynnema sp. NPDC023587]|uniref:hypothetical protein n=1 Tax=Actinosynnema sp. NPDC023587 TaxID=3154695 RepID=UPI0033D767B3